MADKYTDGFDNKPKQSLYSTGKKLEHIVAKAEVAAADADGQLYILAQGISITDTVVGIRLPKGSPSITSGDDYDIGLGYFDADGDVVVVEADVFVDGKDFSSAIAYSDDICESSTTDTIGEALATDVSIEEAKSSYIIYMTANTVGSASGNLDFVIDIAHAA